MPTQLVAGRLATRSRLVAAALVAAVSFSAGCSGAAGRSSLTYGAQMARKGFWREALFRFKRAVEESPSDPRALNNLAVAYESVGETANALAAYKKALEQAPEDPKIKRNYARFAEYYTSSQRASSASAATGPAAAPPAAAPAAPAAPVAPAPSPTPTPAPESPK